MIIEPNVKHEVAHQVLSKHDACVWQSYTIANEQYFSRVLKSLYHLLCTYLLLIHSLALHAYFPIANRNEMKYLQSFHTKFRIDSIPIMNMPLPILVKTYELWNNFSSRSELCINHSPQIIYFTFDVHHDAFCYLQRNAKFYANFWANIVYYICEWISVSFWSFFKCQFKFYVNFLCKEDVPRIAFGAAKRNCVIFKNVTIDLQLRLCDGPFSMPSAKVTKNGTVWIINKPFTLIWCEQMAVSVPN